MYDLYMYCVLKLRKTRKMILSKGSTREEIRRATIRRIG